MTEARVTNFYSKTQAPTIFYPQPKTAMWASEPHLSTQAIESQLQAAVLRRPVARPLPTPPPTLPIPEPDTAFWLTKATLVSGRQIREANLTCMEQLTRMFPST